MEICYVGCLCGVVCLIMCGNFVCIGLCYCMDCCK